MKRSNRTNYIKGIEKKSAFDMIKLLRVAKSKKTEKHLNFWRDNLKSGYPVVETRKLNLVYVMEFLSPTTVSFSKQPALHIL
jgi:hypothetical protein